MPTKKPKKPGPAKRSRKIYTAPEPEVKVSKPKEFPPIKCSLKFERLGEGRLLVTQYLPSPGRSSMTPMTTFGSIEVDAGVLAEIEFELNQLKIQ